MSTETSADRLQTPPIVNIAAYKFITLANLEARRETLRVACRRLGLKGTILLSEEGINVFVAGGRSAIDEFLSILVEDTALAGLSIKESHSDEQPFNRMLVKIKREIIAFDVEGIDPTRRVAPRVSPKVLKQWLDEGRPVRLFDTRNDYEVRLGTFRGAISLDLDHFREFPEAVRSLAGDVEGGPIVVFCTGGIRCEKAAPFLSEVCSEEVYQLDGGILKYFEECGGAHFDGDCFVFDRRVSLDSSLRETDTELCFSCQAPVVPEDQREQAYVRGKSCPRCYRGETELRTAAIEAREERICSIIDPLPGSVPYENRRPLNVPKRYAGLPLLEFLSRWHPQVSIAEWRSIIRRGEIVDEGGALAEDRVVREGERFVRLYPGTIEPNVDAKVRILDEDDSIVVIDKPAPLPVHPCGRFCRNTLSFILDAAYAPQRLRGAHRLDANTSGVMVFSRTRSIARVVQPQFRNRTVEKVYLARVHGRPRLEEFECQQPIAESPGEGGIRFIDSRGLAARTIFSVIEVYPDGTSLVEARPITGRTNQIRLHLWWLGHPVCGDPCYLPDRRTGEAKTLDPDDPPLALHALRIRLDHPETGQSVLFESPGPAWSDRSYS